MTTSNEQTQLSALRSAISETRFATYLRHSAGDEVLAWRLYEWNLEVSSALMTPFNMLEVTLRNRLYEAGARPFGSSWLTTSTHLRAADSRMVIDACDYLNRRNAQVNPGAVIAELSLGFWVGLLANHYDQTLWRQGLHRAFGRGTNRRETHDQLDRLRTLRNRIAHHEHLLNRNLQADLARIDTVLESVNPEVATWVRRLSVATDAISKRPVQSCSPRKPVLDRTRAEVTQKP
jgi:hypothetical protein